MASPTIGVLALQGAFAKHLEVFRSLKVKVKPVRRPQELVNCDALVIPGGESTTISHQMDFIRLTEPIQEFLETKPVFGTCAGTILLAQEVGDQRGSPLGKLNVAVERNGYGSQYESFSAKITTHTDQNFDLFHAVFIRAPRIRQCSQRVSILATLADEPVLVQQDRLLAATFHPELTADHSIHRHFLSMI